VLKLDLTVAALKLMAPLFVAYDRTTYQKLVPHHLADIQKYPPSVLNCLKEGFTVSIIDFMKLFLEVKDIA